MRKQRSAIDRKYELFLARRKDAIDDVWIQNIGAEYRDTYGDPAELAAWHDEHYAGCAERLEAENA